MPVIRSKTYYTITDTAYGGGDSAEYYFWNLCAQPLHQVPDLKNPNINYTCYWVSHTHQIPKFSLLFANKIYFVVFCSPPLRTTPSLILSPIPFSCCNREIPYQLSFFKGIVQVVVGRYVKPWLLLPLIFPLTQQVNIFHFK